MPPTESLQGNSRPVVKVHAILFYVLNKKGRAVAPTPFYRLIIN